MQAGACVEMNLDVCVLGRGHAVLTLDTHVCLEPKERRSEAMSRKTCASTLAWRTATMSTLRDGAGPVVQRG